MRNHDKTPRPRFARDVMVAILVLIFGGVPLAVAMMQRLPRGPEPVAWDREACAGCRMHVGDPRFAAQLQTTDGQVRNYDDPGCLLSDLAANRPPVHAIYFHDHRGDGWIPAAEVAFVPALPTPMGYGLAAVRRGTPGAIDMKSATQRVLHGKDHTEEVGR
jgi:hypothetical protein